VAEAKEQKRIAALKKEQEQLKVQKRKEQQQLETLTKQRKVEEQKRIELEKRAEDERLKKIEDVRLAAQKAAFEKSMAQEQKRLQQEASRAQQRKLAIEKNRYVALIREKVVRNWVKPSGTNPGNSCKVLVHQIPGGEVIDVKATACSGSIAFKNSVERAVFRASPLPMPVTKSLFDREIEFTFTP
ncbi:MAG TPA: cell envelope integrity protein TolA, partial [Ectothiorhodospiraceae bacterium]|nr:cell envelope integrity protein TolA [Ectothiorhodospiraceae bacterium]